MAHWCPRSPPLLLLVPYYPSPSSLSFLIPSLTLSLVNPLSPSPLSHPLPCFPLPPRPSLTPSLAPLFPLSPLPPTLPLYT